VLLFLVAPRPVPAQTPWSTVDELLRKHIELSDDEIRDIQQGKHVTKVLDTDRADEVAVFGVIRIGVPVGFFLERYEDIESFETGKNIEAIGKFSVSPVLEDLAGLTLPKDDIKDIKKCKPGKCEVKMAEDSMRRFQEEVDWASPEYEEQANVVARELGLQLVLEYKHGGNQALGEYWDKKHPQLLADEFRGLMENSKYLFEYNPDLYAFLDRYPTVQLDHSSDFLYWSRVKFGLKPLIRINHVVIDRDSSEDVTEAAIASKAIYSSHYFRAALELRFLIPDPVRRDDQGFYLFSVNRARADGLTGFTGSILRGTIKDRSRKGLEAFLIDGKQKLERLYREQ
jgi:hypothetical protein